MEIRTSSIAYRGGLDVSRMTGSSEFAPSWTILGPALDVRRRGLETESTWAEYKRRYLQEMKDSWERNPVPWLDLLNREEVVLTCYCDRSDLPRCHRILLAHLLVERGRELGVQVAYLGEAYTGWNIYSRSPDGDGIAAALTNPTVLSKKHARINDDYPIQHQGKTYKDVESAYLKLAGTLPSDKDRDVLMVTLIQSKLTCYPWLYFAVRDQGGLAFLETCAHYTRARTASMQSWEGIGRKSRFVRNLIEAYVKAEEAICSTEYEVPQ